MKDSSVASAYRIRLGSGAVQFVLEKIATKLGSLALEEIMVIWGVEDELRKLQRTFLKIQDLVDHVESSKLSFSTASNAWQIWYEDLKRSAYDAEALLDKVSIHISAYHTDEVSVQISAYRPEHPFNNEDNEKARKMILKSYNLIDLPHKIHDMQENLDSLAKEMDSLMLIEKADFFFVKHKTGERSYSSAGYVNMTSLLVDGDIVGREVDKETLINLLQENNDGTYVIPIVGMGGVGKTTLARLLYNDYNVSEGFLKIWISVSMDLDVAKITKEMIEHVTNKSCQLSNLNSLQLKLQKVLAKNKFLLVLDDYWSEIDDDWNLLSLPFRSGCKGSKIIVTTRSTRVSSIVGSVEPYNLETLSDDDCWLLIKQRAVFKREDSTIFESLGRDIAKKCKGLPLAARNIGSVLHRQSTEDEWSSISKSELWDLPQDQNGIFPSLMLSYIHLPANLQRCFAYCSIFPRNHEFEVEELVLLWMAEGFIQPTGERRLEDIGRDYFSDLHLRSFFRSGMNSSNQTVYKMHDLIHDLARLVSANTCVQVNYDLSHDYPLFGKAFHLSLHYNNDVVKLELKASHKNKRLRTFLVKRKNALGGSIDPTLFSNLKIVRVLALTYIGLEDLPDSIKHLIYLRYLNLSGNSIEKLPESICKLSALQTLKLLENSGPCELPSHIKNLSNLRHLYFDIHMNISMPLELGNLTNLQTLSAFFVSKRSNINELANMNALRGSLSIKNLDLVSDERDANTAKLNMKPYLKELHLQWDDLNRGQKLPNDRDPQDLQAQVFTNLEPHVNLKELTIIKYSGIRCPDWLSNSQFRFTRIDLYDLSYCEILPSFGNLPLLKSLRIGAMKSLKTIDHSFYGEKNFPMLEDLNLFQMTELVDWKDVNPTSSMPHLRTLKLDDLPKLTNLPSKLRSVTNSKISSCPSLPLQVIEQKIEDQIKEEKSAVNECSTSGQSYQMEEKQSLSQALKKQQKRRRKKKMKKSK